MRITWFGGSIYRLYVGGEIIVTDGHLSDDVEVRAAADHSVDFASGLPGVEAFVPEATRRARKSLLEEPGQTKVTLRALDNAALVLGDSGEDDLILVERPITWGRFADGAVIVVGGQAENAMMIASGLFVAARPRLLALVADDLSDVQFAHLAEICGDCAVQVLEPGLALEA